MRTFAGVDSWKWRHVVCGRQPHCQWFCPSKL